MNLFFTARILTSEPEYNSSLIEYEIDKTKLQEREQLLKEKKKGRHCHNYPLSLKYNRTLLNIGILCI